MAILSYTADVNGGHYALTQVPAGTRLKIPLTIASYNGREIIPARVYVANFQNDDYVDIIYQGSPKAVVGAYANSSAPVNGYPVIWLDNKGSVAVDVMVVDEKMIPYAEASFAVVATSNPLEQSIFDMLYHFEKGITKNSGTRTDLTYSYGTNVNLSGMSKFGNVGLGFNAAHFGYTIIAPPGSVSYSQDFTVDFWAYRTSANANGLGIFEIWFPAVASIMQVWTLCCGIGGGGNIANTQLVLAENGTGFATGQPNAVANTVFPLATWTHIAITRSGTTVRVFFNGVVGITATRSGTGGALRDRITFFGNGGGQTGTAACLGAIDEVRVHWGVALWTTNFTPPTSPYV